MTENFESRVVNDVATRRKYVCPEIEVINLDAQPRLLSGSPSGARGTAGWGNGLMDNNDEWGE